MIIAFADENINLFFANYSYIIAIISVAIVLFFTIFLFLNKKKTKSISYDKFLNLFVRENIVSIKQDDDGLKVKVKNQDIVKTYRLLDLDFKFHLLNNDIFYFRYDENAIHELILKRNEF